jgi:thymidylate synthase
MNHSSEVFAMTLGPTFEQEYMAVLADILENGTWRDDRTGVGSWSLFSQDLSYDYSSGRFPYITGKKMFFKNTLSEFRWFMAGETDTARFRRDGVHIWDKWADENGNLGPVYGYQARNFNGQGIDQVQGVIDSIRNTPDSRRHIITLWNPVQLSEMRLPPCYLYFQFFTRKEENRLDLFVVQRSADFFVGVPYDIALFGLLLHHVCWETGYLPGVQKTSYVDAHVYANQVDAVREYLTMPTHEFPTLVYESIDDIRLVGYSSNKFIKTEVAV